MTPRAIIAEDEPALAEGLREQLQSLWPELEICAIATDGISALQLFEAHRPNVLFLDIHMPGATGLEVANLAAGRCHLVFVTAFDHYAIPAFEQGAIDYILKPISASRLFTAVKRLKERMSEPAPDPTAIFRVLAERGQPRYLRWINASRGSEICLITTDEVCYFKAEDKYTVVVTGGQEALIRKPLKELLASLDPDAFWQIHRSTVVNVSAIAGVSRDFRGHLLVKLKGRPESLAVAESYNHLFRSA